MPVLVDTNVLVYRFDPRFPEKQARADELLRKTVAEGEARLAHQAIVEFVAATSRPVGKAKESLLSPPDSRREAEDLLSQFDVLYPTEALVRLALRGAAAYDLLWFDAHMWAYAEYFGCEILWSEDFQHERSYGTVTAIDPFRD